MTTITKTIDKNYEESGEGTKQVIKAVTAVAEAVTAVAGAVSDVSTAVSDVTKLVTFKK